jgi:hypothetical protein
MLVAHRFDSMLKMLEAIRGTFVVSGKAGGAAADATTFTDNTGTPFADVLPGDRLHVSGTLEVFTVTTVTDDNNIVVDLVLSAGTPLAGADWKIFRGGLDLDQIKLGPMPDPMRQGSGILIYDEKNFVV